MFQVKINNNNLTVATAQDLPGLHLREDDLIHLGDYDSQANGLYICKMSRGDLYKKYSILDYDLIDFGIPIEYWEEAENFPMVMYYGKETNIFGCKMYDKDVLSLLASKVARMFFDCEYSLMKVYG